MKIQKKIEKFRKCPLNLFACTWEMIHKIRELACKYK